MRRLWCWVLCRWFGRIRLSEIVKVTCCSIAAPSAALNSTSIVGPLVNVVDIRTYINADEVERDFGGGE